MHAYAATVTAPQSETIALNVAARLSAASTLLPSLLQLSLLLLPIGYLASR
ncbi:hypothetical protein [Undibacterium sp.]|uniref:hypothetical protein n=1 Tax=Undibacterium sp. TaxID=1914977 RepID=UPI00374CEF75